MTPTAPSLMLKFAFVGSLVAALNVGKNSTDDLDEVKRLRRAGDSVKVLYDVL